MAIEQAAEGVTTAKAKKHINWEHIKRDDGEILELIQMIVSSGMLDD